MTATTQISAHISMATKELLERYVRSHGATRAHVLEQALLHYLQAVDSLPTDAIIPARVVLTNDSAQKVRELNSYPPPPTEEMRKLFNDD